MKCEIGDPQFQPVTITLETPEEVSTLAGILAHVVTGQEATFLYDLYIYLSDHPGTVSTNHEWTGKIKPAGF